MGLLEGRWKLSLRSDAGVACGCKSLARLSPQGSSVGYGPLETPGLGSHSDLCARVSVAIVYGVGAIVVCLPDFRPLLLRLKELSSVKHGMIECP